MPSDTFNKKTCSAWVIRRDMQRYVSEIPFSGISVEETCHFALLAARSSIRVRTRS